MIPCAKGTIPYVIQPGDTSWIIAHRFNTSVNAISKANPGLNLTHLNIGQIICIPIPQNRANIPHNEGEFSKAKVDLMNKMRELWEEHVAWTRMVILSMAINNPDTTLTTNRLLRNPSDFTAQLTPLYGSDIASRFEALLKSHLMIASQLVQSAKAGDNSAAAEAERQWYANADEIATFLASINPYWSENDWKTMLHQHLALTKSEAVNRLQGNYAEDIRIYDEIQAQALQMADKMSEGISRQFPNRF
ncbi:MAG: LysM domain-containing protein [Bacillota bacterium]|nr:LysM domain-containing protein [Bacillota bacterium]